jgi:hypothetical protein
LDSGTIRADRGKVRTMDSYGMEVFATERSRERTAAAELRWFLREARREAELDVKPPTEPRRSWPTRLALALTRRRAHTAEAS